MKVQVVEEKAVIVVVALYRSVSRSPVCFKALSVSKGAFILLYAIDCEQQKMSTAN